MRKNPKSEGRRPKEARSSKSEWDGALDFWNWGDAPSNGAMVLREAHSGGSPPPRQLGERMAQFGEAILRFVRKIPAKPANNRLIDQLVGAATSVGANYCEADDAISGKEFKLKICLCRKESKESMFFLRMVATAEESLASEARILWREAKELNLIFGAIWRK